MACIGCKRKVDVQEEEEHIIYPAKQNNIQDLAYFVRSAPSKLIIKRNNLDCQQFQLWFNQRKSYLKK